MPSTRHEVLTDMFVQRPSLAAHLLTDVLGIDLPGYAQAEIKPTDCTVLAPTEYRADAVVLLSGDAEPVMAVVVEVQLSRKQVKRWSWPVYVATVRSRYRCPSVLLVVCDDASVATWCAAPIELGPGSTLTPLVLGPDRIPVIVDTGEAARTPELAVLSAMAHGGDPNRGAVLDAMLGAIATIDTHLANLYCDLVLNALPEAARRRLEELMATGTYEYQSDFARRYFSEGKAEGKAEGAAEGKATAVLAVLDARAVDVPTIARARISECTDLDQLDAWIRRAATAASVHDLWFDRT